LMFIILHVFNIFIFINEVMQQPRIDNMATPGKMLFPEKLTAKNVETESIVIIIII